MLRHDMACAFTRACEVGFIQPVERTLGGFRLLIQAAGA